MSENAAAAPKTDTSTPTPPATQKTDSTAAVGGVFAMGLGGFASLLFLLIFSYGAAKLSYDKYQSIGWAILNFFFATFYYPYYAIFLSGPQSQYGGRRRR